MSRRSRKDREIGREAARIFMPLVFWFLAFGFYMGLAGLFESVPWGRFVVGGIMFILIVVGAWQVPRAIRTIRAL